MSKNIVLNEGNGKIINSLFTQWDKIKTQSQHNKWVSKLKATSFGTYGTIPIIEVLEKFDPKFINTITKDAFYYEIKNYSS